MSIVRSVISNSDDEDSEVKSTERRLLPENPKSARERGKEEEERKEGIKGQNKTRLLCVTFFAFFYYYY